MAYLTANNGPEQGRRYELRLPNSVVGRHPDCAIHVDVGAVSRQHAQIVREGQDFYVEDLKSRNGTFVNDQRVEGRLKLHSGDQLRICDVAFTFSTGQQPAGDEASHSSSGLGADAGPATVFVDLIEDLEEDSTTIMSKVNASSRHGRVQLAVSPEVKLDALLEVTRGLGKALALDEVLPQVLNSLFKIFVQADRGFIVMKTEDGRLIPMWTKVRRENAEDTIRISRTIVNQVMETQEAILSADAATDSRFEMSQSIADFRIRSMMCAPLIDSEGHSMGVLHIDTLDQRFQSEDLEVLASAASQAGIAIHAAQMHENALRQRAVERDLEVAHEVQRGFLPETPPDVDGYEFFDYYEPANHVGGDYYDYIRLPDGRVAVIVADVVGHGIAAALLTAKLSAEARYSLASEEDVATAVTKLNDAMCRLGLDRFVTMIATVLNPATHEVTIVNAGHMAPMLRHADGSVTEPGESLAGLPLGISAGLTYEQLTVQLAPGEMVTMYTDGINESMSAAAKMYGIKRIREIIADSETSVPGELGQTLVDDVRRFLHGAQQDDDICLVCFGRVSGGESPLPRAHHEVSSTLSQVRKSSPRPQKETVEFPRAESEVSYELVAQTLQRMKQGFQHRKVIRYRGEYLRPVQNALLDASDEEARNLLSSGFHRLVVMDAAEGLDGAGKFDLMRFQKHMIEKMVAAFQYDFDGDDFYPGEITEYLRDEEASLFCFLNVQHFTTETFRCLRGLGFFQSGHSSLYCGEHSYLNGKSSRIAEI